MLQSKINMKRQQYRINVQSKIQNNVSLHRSQFYNKINQRKMNSRIKTQNDYRFRTIQKQQAYTNITIAHTSQKMFHPDIYHRPTTRKKYFHQLIDTYMNWNYNTPQKNIDENRKVNKNNNYNCKIHVINQLPQQDEQNKQMDSQQKSPAIIDKQKRAQTAGYKRKTNNNFKNSESIASQIKVSNFKTLYSLNQEGITLNRYKKDLKQKLESKCNKNQTKYRQLTQKIHKQTQITFKQDNQAGRTKRSSNPQADLNNSFSSHSNSLLFREQFEFDNLSKNKSSSKMKNVGTTNKKNIKSSLHTIQNQREVKSLKKSFLQFGNSTIKINIKSLIQNPSINKQQIEIHQLQKETLQLQVNQRLKMLGPKFDSNYWSIIFVYQNNIYKIYQLVGKSQMPQTQDLKLANISLDISDKKSLRKIKIKKFQNCEIGTKMNHILLKIKQFCLSHMWETLPKNKSIQYKISGQLYWSPSVKPLRQRLFKIIKQQLKSQQNPQYFIQKTPAYSQIFHNNCQQFKDIIIAVAKDLQKMNGKIINNKLNLDNLYQLQQKSIKIGDWGCSALCRKIQVSGKQVIFRDQPIIKTYKEYQNKTKSSWLISLENLPPEVIQCLIQGNYSNIWEIQACPEVWSLGIIIYQILTCIPVWMPFPSIVNHTIPKKGILYDCQKSLSQIFQLQSKLPSAVARWLRDEKNTKLYKQTHPQILNLMKQMLQLNPKLRPKPADIIKRLNSR